MAAAVTAAVGFAVIATGAQAQNYATGDPRIVEAPQYPPVCQRLEAHFSTSERATPPATDDTARIQEALDECAGSGRSVVLAPSGPNDAFYSAMLTVNGEGLVVDSGATLEGNNAYGSQSEHWARSTAAAT